MTLYTQMEKECQYKEEITCYNVPKNVLAYWKEQ